jgi:MYXO-CTERM domain-containing protein
MMRSFRQLVTVGICGVLAVAVPERASACGGTFCDSGPRAMPVDQTGENVIFVMDDGFVEAHVQIQYQGDPERFAWIVPMQKLPDVQPGSAALFANVLTGTVPSYGFSVQRAQCGLRSAKSSNQAGNAVPDTLGESHIIVFHKTVGAFDVAALQGGTADEVVSWLSQNGYQGIDTAPEILQRYVDKGFVFVAVKLTAGAGLDEIHPLMFRYPGTEPCVPLELTSVAAVPDMNVRTFFFGSERVVPTNYRHVVVNSLKIDWLQLGANYDAVVSRAVDEKGADGHGFLTEYAGPSSVVSSQGLFQSAWDASRFSNLTPLDALTELQAQGFVSCAGSCSFSNPLVEPLLEEFLPSPNGVDPATYYGCPSCSAGADLSKWDAAKFASELDTRIIQPAHHAADILANHPYLTRLLTRISPEEMTEDPVFASVSGIGDVSLPTPATEDIDCAGTGAMTLPDGRRVALGNPPKWPAFTGMPYAARIEDFSSGSAASVVSDNTGRISQMLEESNSTGAGCGCRLEPESRSRASGAWPLAGIIGILAVRRGTKRKARI